MIFSRTRTIFEIVYRSILMTHLVNNCFGNVFRRTIKKLRTNVQFVSAFVILAFFPNLLS